MVNPAISRMKRAFCAFTGGLWHGPSHLDGAAERGCEKAVVFISHYDNHGHSHNQALRRRGAALAGSARKDTDPPLQGKTRKTSSPGIKEVTMPEYFALTFQHDSFNFSRFQIEKILGDRLVVGLKTLDLATKVRILVPQPRSHRLAVRTLASHAGNQGSIPCGTTRTKSRS
jgi:hypothetical protein